MIKLLQKQNGAVFYASQCSHAIVVSLTENYAELRANYVSDSAVIAVAVNQAKRSGDA